MRQNIIKKGDEFLRYEIREIVEVARKIEKYGIPMTWENIGDPIAKGEKIPKWMKDIIQESIHHDKVFAYAPTKGLTETREFILRHYSNEKVCTIEDIIFFNGLGEAINKLFSNLPSNARVIGPNPTYPSHATAEAMHHGGSHITYSLDPNNHWEPDIEELENKVRFNESIVGILVINPNNPTGTVYKKETLERIVAIAKKYNCFVIFDEIYQNIVFDWSKVTRLCDIIGDVPGISMKGISKEVPWPGSRCGWIEVYNADKDANFRGYINTIVVSKMLEVSSTTLPQVVFPRIVESEHYPSFFKERIEKYEKRANLAVEIFSKSPYLQVTKPDGVFYLTVCFRLPKGLDRENVWKCSMEAHNKEIRLYVDAIRNNEKLTIDKHLAYELMGSRGICVVPLSGFNCPLDGFRMTLLEEDESKFIRTCEQIRSGVEEFFGKIHASSPNARESELVIQ